jgi:pyruvate dehydrogenase E2 component (dihydrolipoamide acetyltransferase)
VPSDVTLPQLGESVTEGVVTAWLVEVGDTVEVDQPLVEVSTDKVDTEIPSPVAGTVRERRAEVDQTVEVGEVIAVVDADGEEPAAEAPADEAPEAEAPAEKQPAAGAPAGKAPDEQSPRRGGDTRLSPVVRRKLDEAGLTPDDLTGTGRGGRITREDVEAAIEARAGEGGAEESREATKPAAPAPAAREPEPAPAAAPQPAPTGRRERTEELTRVRRTIARHMHASLQTTAQLTAVVEADLTGLMTARARAKDAFRAREGLSLSPFAIIARAVVRTLPRHPALNASMDLEAGTVTYHDYVNLGIAVDTDRGLLVPNVKDAQDLTIAGLARRVADLAERARSGGLTPDDISGGTITLTNTGSRGVMMDTPVLNPPEAAILATTLVEKRPVVVTDELGQDGIAIRWMSYLCLTYDHRLVDGADAARFLTDLTSVLEDPDLTAELPS